MELILIFIVIMLLLVTPKSNVKNENRTSTLQHKPIKKHPKRK